jgi:AraC family transcriptional regulator
MPRRDTTSDDYQRRILRAQQLLEARLDQPIAPAELARAASFSLHHFHRIFRAQLGESVMQHVRRLRLERAARTIRAGQARLIDVALEAGYESHEAFTRAFIERFGVAPSELRGQPSARLAAWVCVPGVAAAVTVRDEPARRVAFMRARGSYAGVGAHWQKMIGWASARGLLGPVPTLYGICPDDPDVTEEALLRFDTCVVVPDDFVGDDAVAITALPAGSFAIGVHVGPYDRLHETYLDVIGRWFPTSGYELAPEPVIEHYLDDPACTPAEALRTEVRVRIAD